MSDISELKGSLSDTSAFERKDPRFAKAFEFLRRPDLAELPDGRHEIDGDEIFAMVSSPALKPYGTGKIESHRKYIDIHAPINGRETIGMHTLTEAELALPFDVEKDFMVFDGETEPVEIGPGEFLVCYPPLDGHAPCGTRETPVPQGYRKVCLKIRAQ